MKVHIKSWHGIAQWRWDIGNNDADDDGEGDVCGICRVPFEGCCPSCKMPGDDCPLIWGECTHVFHMHCLLQWIGTAASKQQCPMDRRPWGKSEPDIAMMPPAEGLLQLPRRGKWTRTIPDSLKHRIVVLQDRIPLYPYCSHLHRIVYLLTQCSSSAPACNGHKAIDV
ncbi:RING/U-box [Trametes cingulata]|nr:RING/U-box [Trametes cingulata]